MRRTSLGRLIWGIILLAVGVGFLLQALAITSFNDFLHLYWPIALMVIGLAELVSGRFYAALVWVVAGAVFQLRAIGVLHGDIWSIIWPLIVILIGLRVLLRPTDLRMKVEEKSFSGSTAVFSGSVKKITSKDFKGSSASAVFGGAKLDLSGATVSNDGAVIDVDAIFGGVEIIVPKSTPVKTDIVSIFGGHEDKRNQSEIDESQPEILIRGNAIFGGVEIKN